jgi:hypothetical protein
MPTCPGTLRDSLVHDHDLIMGPDMVGAEPVCMGEISGVGSSTGRSAARSDKIVWG